MKVINILGAEAKGEVVKILVNEGQAIKKGDVLMEIKWTF